jgi:hypothetical protein
VKGRFLFALAAAAAVCAFVSSPALAAGSKCHAKKSGSSAVNIYTDQVTTSGLCSKHSLTSSGGQSYVPRVILDPKVAKKLRQISPAYQALLRRIATDPELGAVQQLHYTKIAALGPPPSAVSAAFDLGSGPTALFAALLAAAALLALGGGLHRGRR